MAKTARRAKSPHTTSGSGIDGVGSTLRRIRQVRGLSLNDVAEVTQMSSWFLSLVETGASDHPIGRLGRLVEFYGISITDLMPDPGAAEPDIVLAAERRLIHSPAEG